MMRSSGSQVKLETKIPSGFSS